MSEHPSHGTTECGWQVGESGEHDTQLIQSKWCFESCFPSIFLFDADVFISPPDVKFGKEILPLQVFKDSVDEQEWVCIFYGPGVQDSIVHDGLKFPVFLLSEEKWQGVW